MPGRIFFVKTLIVTAIIRAALWLLPFRQVQKLVNKLAESTKRSSPAHWPATNQIARTVTVASRFVPAASCLTQALTTQILLGYYGRESILRIGVARSEDGEFRAHAWVEANEQVVIGGTADYLATNYVALPAIKGDS